MREFMNDMLCLNLLLLTSAILIATKIPERKLLRTEAASVTFVLVEVANLLSFIFYLLLPTPAFLLKAGIGLCISQKFS